MTSPWALAILLLLAALLLALPLLPAMVELYRKSDAAPLQVIQEHAGEIRHFAQSFRAYIRGIASHLQQCAEMGTEGNGVLRDGSQYLLVGNPDVPLLLRSEKLSRTSRRVILSAVDLTLLPAMTFAKEFYARGELKGGEGNTYRAILGEKRIELGARSRVVRWLHSARELHAGCNCELYGRVSADGLIRLQEGCTFERLNAPRIEFGGASAADGHAQPLPAERNPLSGEMGMDEAPRPRRLIAGDFAVPAGAVVTENIVSRGQLRIGRGARVRGSVKSNQDLLIEAGATVEGSAISAGKAEIGAGCRIRGPVLAEHEVLVRRGAQCGSLDRPTTVSAPRIAVEDGAVMFGTVWAREQGTVKPS